MSERKQVHPALAIRAAAQKARRIGAALRFNIETMAQRFVGTPHLFYTVIIVAAAPTFVFNWDLIEKLAQLDISHQGWFIDETVTLVAILAIAVIFRHTTLLRREVRRRQAAEAEAASLARHDPLTGLPNRRMLQEVITEAIGLLPAGSSRAALMVDLDGFKAVNDLHGHPFGDALLCAVVERLASLMEHGSNLARLGGDEFAVLLRQNLTREEVERVAGRIVARLAEPFRLADRDVQIGASVGIAFAPADGAATSALLRAADVALYRAKSDGRGAYRFFEPAMERGTRESATLKAELRQAAASAEVEPLFRPTGDLMRGAAHGREAAARWRNPSRGLLGSDSFVPLAEDMCLSYARAPSLLEKFCCDARQASEERCITINVSPGEVRHPRLCKCLAALIEQAGPEPSRFDVEITRAALMRDMERARQAIRRLRPLDLTVMPDDFGAGHTIFDRLREAAVGTVKIQRPFLRRIAANHTEVRRIEAVIRLALGLGFKVSIEGIEDADDPVVDELTNPGCTLGHGHLLGGPIAAAEGSAMLARVAARRPAAASAAWRRSA